MAIKKYKTKNGSQKYQATIWNHNCPIASKTFDKKVFAQTWLREQKRNSTNLAIGKPKVISLEEIFQNEYLMKKELRPGTKQTYQRNFRCHIGPVLGKRKIDSITADEWERLLKELAASGQSRQSVNRIHALASSIYTFAIKRDFASSNPLKKIDYNEKELGEIAYWALEDAERFFKWAFETNNPRLPIYLMAFETGLRISEIIALKWDCIDLNNGIVEVRRSYCKLTGQLQEHTKNNKRRFVGISKSLAAIFKRERPPVSHGYVFRPEGKAHYTYQMLYHRFRGEQLKAKVKLIGLHGLRHTHASIYVERGGSIYDLKQVLGHEDLTTTMRYAHLSKEHVIQKSKLVTLEIPKDSKGIPTEYSPSIVDKPVRAEVVSRTSN